MHLQLLIAVAVAVVYRMTRPDHNEHNRWNPSAEGARLQGLQNDAIALDSIARLDSFLAVQARPEDIGYGEPLGHRSQHPHSAFQYVPRQFCSATKVSAQLSHTGAACSVRIVTPPDMRAVEIEPSVFDHIVCEFPSLHPRTPTNARFLRPRTPTNAGTQTHCAPAYKHSHPHQCQRRCGRAIKC